METLDAEQFDSLVFGLSVMILAVITVRVCAALVVKLKTARAATIERGTTCNCCCPTRN